MQKTISTLLCTLFMILIMTACGGSGTVSQTLNSENNVVSDGAEMQTEDSSLPVRNLPAKGIRIKLSFGDTVIPAVLDRNKTARALIRKLPIKLYMSRFLHGFSGVIEELPYDPEEVHNRGLNGDINYETNTQNLSILFHDGNISEQNGDWVNIGVISCPFTTIEELHGSYTVLIELEE